MRMMRPFCIKSSSIFLTVPLLLFRYTSSSFEVNSVCVFNQVFSCSSSLVEVGKVCFGNFGLRLCEILSSISSAVKHFTRPPTDTISIRFWTLGLITEDGYFTNLGLLFSNQCEHTIKCARYLGNDKLEFQDRKEFRTEFQSLFFKYWSGFRKA